LVALTLLAGVIAGLIWLLVRPNPVRCVHAGGACCLAKPHEIEEK
jgi:hypothetical protein